MNQEEISPWIARLAKAVAPKPPVPERRPVYDFDMPTDPLDRYAREQDVWNNSTVSPQQASANKSQNARDLLSIIPGPGNLIAAEDAVSGAGEASTSFGEGRYGKGTLQAALAALSGLGAVTGLPTGRLAGSVARGAKDVAPAFPAWHGSPHDFDEFKLDKIGTGEGAQAYGHGLYFAENPGVAKSYQNALGDLRIDGKPAADSLENTAALKKLQGGLDGYVDGWKQNLARSESVGDQIGAGEARKALAAAERVKTANVSQGRLYHTEIDAEPHQLLDWDKSLSQQSPEVQAALARLGYDPGKSQLTGAQILDEIARKNVNGDWGAPGDFAREQASRTLREAGVPGIRYLDQGSRGAGANPTSNYVIFDDKLVKVLGKE